MLRLSNCIFARMVLSEEQLNLLNSQNYLAVANFLDQNKTEALRAELLSLEKIDAFKKAGIGRELQHHVDATKRGDFIHWIDQQAPSAALAIYLDKINALIGQLNRRFFLGIRDFECHFAIYPEQTFYEKHVDRHRTGSHRIVSFVFYLNENWQHEDSGQLKIYQESGSTELIEPIAGTLALFFSDLPHEVLKTNKRRLSITGWMLDKMVI
jgi:SM-20-related protein